MRIPSRRVARLATLAGLGFLVAACSDSTSPLAPVEAERSIAGAEGPQPAGAPAPTPSQTNYEIDFMTDMIDHHHMAIMTSQLCVEKAVHEELRALCQEIIAAQQAEIEQMQAWLQDWYGIAYEPEMKQSGMRMMEKLAALSPAEFEVAFMEMMIKHHAKAVKEGEHCLEKAYHPELISMCENIIETQSEEIALMESWLCAWYGICS